MTPEVATLLLQTFKGREEYLAYQPANSNPSPKKLNGPIPVDKFIERHTNGSSCGVYFLRPDNKVWMTCADFDDHTGNNPDCIPEAQSFAQFLIKQGFPALLERSQSGTGAHVWVFFAEPIPANIARIFMIGAMNDAETFQGNESFPKQSVLTTERPLGNYVRYPLSGKSAFLDVETLLELDPTEALTSVVRIPPKQIEDKHWWNTADIKQQVSSADYDVEGLPERVRLLMESAEGDLLAKRWMGDVTGMSGDRTNSGLCLAMATEMVRHYIPTPEIEAAIHFWCVLNAYTKGLRDQWTKNTVKAAYSNLMGRKVEDLSYGVDKVGAILHSTIEKIVSGVDTDLITTGMRNVDASLGGGLGLGEFIIVAGRPSQGKSTTGWHMLDSAAKQGIAGGFVSLEMTELDIMSRHISRLSPIPKDKWADAEVAKTLHRLVDEDLKAKAPIYFTRGGNQSLPVVIECIKDYAQRGAKLIVVDYVQIISERGSDYERVTKCSRELAKLCRELNIALVVMAQLGRPDSRNRNLVMPRLSDLKNTGQLEQDADVVLAVVWPHQEFPEQYTADQFNVCVLKNRNRGIKRQVVPVRFDPERQMLT